MSSVTATGVRVAPSPTAGARRLAAEVGADLRWSVTGRRGWLGGLVLNLMLAVAYLTIEPISAGTQQDWAVLVGTYFAVFVLADGATTNLLGLDADRVRSRLDAGVSLARVLLVKNLTLLLVVGLPVLLATAVLTTLSEGAAMLEVTVPAVLFPILVWLGVGNVASTVLPVRRMPLRERWEHRRDRHRSAWWLGALALPYAVCVALDPLDDVADAVVAALGTSTYGSHAEAAAVLLGLGLSCYVGLTATAVAAGRRFGHRLHASLAELASSPA